MSITGVLLQKARDFVRLRWRCYYNGVVSWGLD
jgi:hypothetical protein